ncbi:hypothetical protein HK100_006409, partial [Physocladia obscura]
LSTDDVSDLFSPCRCKGSCLYVHRTCLRRWNETVTRNSVLRRPHPLAEPPPAGSRKPVDSISCSMCHYVYRKKNSKFGTFVEANVDQIALLLIGFLMYCCGFGWHLFDPLHEWFAVGQFNLNSVNENGTVITLYTNESAVSGILASTSWALDLLTPGLVVWTLAVEGMILTMLIKRSGPFRIWPASMLYSVHVMTYLTLGSLFPWRLFDLLNEALLAAGDQFQETITLTSLSIHAITCTALKIYSDAVEIYRLTSANAIIFTTLRVTSPAFEFATQCKINHQNKQFPFDQIMESMEVNVNVDAKQTGGAVTAAEAVALSSFGASESIQAALRAWSAYQQEIDSITKRSKTAESAFLALYKHLAEAPDPAPLLAALSNHPTIESELVFANAEVERLKNEVSSLEKEMRDNRIGDMELGRLKTRLASYEVKFDEMVAEKVLAKEIELKAAADEKIRIFKETEYALQRQLNFAKDQLFQLQSTHDVTQARLVDYGSAYDAEVAGKLGELEIVVADLERANQKFAAVSRDNEILRGELAGLRGEKTVGVSSGIGQHRHDWQDPTSLQRKIKVQDGEISKLLDDLN